MCTGIDLWLFPGPSVQKKQTNKYNIFPLLWREAEFTFYSLHVSPIMPCTPGEGGGEGGGGGVVN